MYKADDYKNQDNILLDILDEFGNKTEKTATKAEIHKNNIWHNEASVFIINREGKILLQRRSPIRVPRPNKYGMIATHPKHNQSINESIIEKAKEEIGYNLKASDIRFLCKIRQDGEQNNIVYFYYAKLNISDKDIKLNNVLATEYRWFNLSELFECMLAGSDDTVFVNQSHYVNVFALLEKIVKGNNTDNLIKQQEAIIYETEDGCAFPGILYHPLKKTDSVAIFIHGNGNNYYKSPLYIELARECAFNNVALINICTRGSDYELSYYKEIGSNLVRFIGGTRYEDVSDCIYDIGGAVNFAIKRGYKKISLIGHSMGTQKVMYYVTQKNVDYNLILLAPLDMSQRLELSEGKNYSGVIDIAQAYVRSNKPYQMITKDYSAIKIVSAMIPNNKTQVLVLQENTDSAKSFNYKGNITSIYGTADDCLTSLGLDKIELAFNNQFPKANKKFTIIPNANHEYRNFEKEAARAIAEGIIN